MWYAMHEIAETILPTKTAPDKSYRARKVSYAPESQHWKVCLTFNTGFQHVGKCT